MIADMISIKILHTTVTGLLIRGRELNITLIFISQSHFIVPKDIRLNIAHYFIIKILNRRDLQQIASDIDFKDFTKLYRKCTAKSFSFWVLEYFMLSKKSNKRSIESNYDN